MDSAVIASFVAAGAAWAGTGVTLLNNRSTLKATRATLAATHEAQAEQARALWRREKLPEVAREFESVAQAMRSLELHKPEDVDGAMAVKLGERLQGLSASIMVHGDPKLSVAALDYQYAALDIAHQAAVPTFKPEFERNVDRARATFLLEVQRVLGS